MKKSMTIRKKTLLTVLGVTTAATVGVSCLFMENVKTVNADGATFAMVDGASVYLQGDDTSGIRFAAQLPEADKDKEVSFLVVHKEMLVQNDKMVEGKEADIDVHGDVVAQLCEKYGVEESAFATKFTVTEAKTASYYTAEDFPEAGYYACGAIIDLPSSVYTSDFFSVGYYMDGGTRVYAEFTDSVTRSISEVSNATLAAQYDKYEASGDVDTLLSFMEEEYGDDRFAYVNLGRNSLDFDSANYTTTTTPEVVDYVGGSFTGVNGATVENTVAGNGITYPVLNFSEGEIVAPVVENNDHLVKYTIDAVRSEHNVISIPVWYSSAEGNVLSNAQKAVVEGIIANGNKICLDFYVYNATAWDQHIMLVSEKLNYSVAASLEHQVAATGKWTHVQFDVTDLITDGNNYQFGVYAWSWVSNAVYKDVEFGGVAKSSQQIYYIDGLQFIEKTPMELSTYSANYQRTKDTTVLSSADTDSVSYKYVYTKAAAADSADGIITVLRGRFFKYSATIGDDAIFGLDAKTDWTNLYCGFWIKKDTTSNIDILLSFRNSQDGSTYKGSGSMEFTSYAYGHKAVGSSTDWVYMEYNLSALYSGYEIYTTGVTAYEICLNTETSAESANIYIDELKIFRKDPMDLPTYSANYQRTQNTAILSTEDTDGVSSQYTFTTGFANNVGDGINNANRGRFLYYSATVGEDKLFGLDANTDWANLYCGFWIKEDLAKSFDVLVTFRNTQDGSTYKGSGEMSFASYNYGHKGIGSGTDWIYMEYNLSALYSGYEIYTTDVTAYTIAISTEMVVDSTATFYVDELRIYSK